MKRRCNKGKGCNFAHTQDDLRQPGEVFIEHLAPASVANYIAPPPAVTHAASAPVVEYVAPMTELTYAAPAPVAESVAPTTSMTYAARGPVVEYVASTTEVTYAAPAPAVETTVCAWCSKGKECYFAHSQDEVRRLGEARHEDCLSPEA